MEDNNEVQGTFQTTELARFLASPTGRTVRAVSGGWLIGAGLARGGSGYLLALIGLVPLLAGVFDFCVASAATGGPLWGDDIRAGEGGGPVPVA